MSANGGVFPQWQMQMQMRMHTPPTYIDTLEHELRVICMDDFCHYVTRLRIVSHMTYLEA